MTIRRSPALPGRAPREAALLPAHRDLRRLALIVEHCGCDSRNVVATEAHPGRAPDLRLVIGLILLLAYALPLFVPPPARPFLATTHDASLIARIFPDVPVWWVVLRLLALLAGAALISSIAPKPPTLGRRRLESELAGSQRTLMPGMRTQYAALLAAAGHAASVHWVSPLPAAGQSLYMLWLGVPSLLLAWGTSRTLPNLMHERRSLLRIRWVVGALIACWLTTRLGVSWHSPRTADVVDMWRAFAGLTQMAKRGGNFLVESVGLELPGVNSVPFFLQGLPALQLASIAPSLGWVQVVNSLWLALSGAAVAALAATVVGRATAVVATAALLFSPFMLLGPMTPTPVFVGPLFTACAALFLLWFRRTGSPVAFTIFGSVAGLAITNPSLAVVTTLVLLLAALRLVRRPRLPFAVVLTALCSFLAAALPSLPGPGTIRQMAQVYSGQRGRATVLEQTVFAQLPKESGADAGWHAEPPGSFDLPMATLLSPFAIARSPMRLWGDALFDPIGASLAAVGLAVCVRYALRDATSALLLAFLCATLVTGFISSTDRPSLLRIMGAPVAVALMAAVGWAGIQTVLRDGAAARYAPTVAALAIVISGTLIFDVVNPRILPASSLGLLVRSLRPNDLERAVLLNDPRERAFWRFVDEVTTQVPTRPIAVAQLEDFVRPADRPAGDVATPELFFWSPAVEQTAGIGARLCARWPEAALYTIVDAAHLSRLYAARPMGPGWQPALPASQWSVQRCTVSTSLGRPAHLSRNACRGAFQS